MDILHCDVAVIGAGTGGLAAREAAAKAGAKTLVIEAGRGGTTCARVGCMPSKLLLAAANAAQGIRDAVAFGIETSPPLLDGPAILQRLRRERDFFVGGVLETFDALGEQERIFGQARFIGPNRLAIDDRYEVAAKAVVIATGAKPGIPPLLRPIADKVLTNETIFELTDLPRSLAVIGSGPLGLEIGLAMQRLGVRVTIFDQATQIAGLSDAAVAGRARAILGKAVDLKLGVSLTAELDRDRHVRIGWKTDGGDALGSDSFDYVLAATGRPPNLEALDLKRAEIALDEKGTPLFDPETMRCGESAIFIAGDCDAQRPVLHDASHEGFIAGSNAAALPHVERHKRHTQFSIVFTQPGIAMVGPKLDPSMKADLAIGHRDLSDNGRARIEAKDEGLICLYADRLSGKLIGGQIVAPMAEHLGHLLCWVVETGLTASQAADLPTYHPTIEEAFHQALKELAAQIA